MFRSALLILSGNSFLFLVILARNLLIARMISVEDYGIASTFAISMAVIEMMSDLGLQQMIVQDREGNDPKLQAALQGFHLFRAIVGAIALYALAHPIARFLNIPDTAWAFQVLALVPLANGFLHFDIHRKNRAMVFLPFVLTKTLPALASLILIWPLNQYFGDYRVMLYALMVQIFLTVSVSHLVADRPYRLRVDWDVTRRAFGFGWPLLLNGILLFAVFHGEKIIVGRELGMASLAVFALGFTLTLRPTVVMTSSAQSFFLPQLSSAHDDPTRFQHLTMTILQVSLFSGILLVVAMTLFGGPFVRIVLGEKYADLVPLLQWLAILQAFRAFKAGAAVTSVSRAMTSNAMIANLFRVGSMPISWYIAATSGDILLVLLVATIGEACGYAASMTLLKFRLGTALRPMVLPAGLALTVLLISAVGTGWGLLPSDADQHWVFVGLLVAAFIAAVASMGDLHRYVSARVAFTHTD